MSTRLTPEQLARITPQMLGMARRQAMIAWAKNKRQDGEELVSVAYQGLVTAAKNFDAERTDIDPDDLASGRAFAGYAKQRIVGSLLDWQRKIDFVPKRVRKSYKDLQAIGHGSGITASELSLTTGLPEQTIRTVIHAVENMPVSLDDRPESIDEANASEVGNVFLMAAEVDVESDATVALLTSTLADEWSKLPFLSRAALANKFYFGQNMKQSSDALGCSSAELREALNDGLAAILGALQGIVSNKR